MKCTSLSKKMFYPRIWKKSKEIYLNEISQFRSLEMTVKFVHVEGEGGREKILFPFTEI